MTAADLVHSPHLVIVNAYLFSPFHLWMPNVHSVWALYSYTYFEVNIVGFCYCIYVQCYIVYCVIQFRFISLHAEVVKGAKKRNIRF